LSRGVLALCVLLWPLIGLGATGCPHHTPQSGDWMVVRGYGTGPKVEAIRKAREDARRAVAALVRGAHSEAVVGAFMETFNTTLTPPHYDPANRTACVLGIAPKGAIPAAIQAESAALDRALTALAGDVRARLKERHTLRIELPIWGTGRDAGALGQALFVQLQGAFTGTRTAEHRPHATLAGQLGPAAGGDRCVFVPTLKRRGAGAIRLSPIDLDPKVLNAKDCRPAPPPQSTAYLADAQLGLDAGGRRGASGLEVSLTTSARPDQLCGGELFDLRVHTNQPAQVRVYSVAEDGRTLLGWAHGPVDGEWRVTPAPTSVRLDGGQGYRIVAVATPVKAGFGALVPSVPAGQPGACMGPDGLATRRLPAQAAVATFTHGVRDPAAPGCPPDPALRERHQAVLAAVRALPRCPTR
jgi:hypothetical protein